MESYTASAPTSEAVWEDAAAAPTSLRPTFSITTGLRRARASSRACTSLSLSRAPSM